MKRNKILKTLLISLAVLVGLGFFLIVFMLFIQQKVLSRGSYELSTTTDTIDFYYSSTGHILVDVYFPEYDQTYPFILDCGASNFLFSEHASKFNFRRSSFGLGKGAKGNFFTTRILKFGNIQIGNIQLEDINAQEIFYPSDCSSEAVGLIGTGVMRHFDWQIDFKKEQIVVGKTLDDLEFSSDTIAFPVRVNPGSNHLKTSIKFAEDKLPHWLLIDIGNSGTLLLRDKSVVQDSMGYREVLLKGQSTKGLGEKESSVSKEKIILIDSMRFRKSDFVVYNVSANTTPNALNLLGLGFFSNYKTTLSWSTKTVLLEPYDSVPEYSWKTYGFRMEYDKSQESTIISAIYENSSADAQQLPLYAQVLAIDSMPLKTAEDLCSFRSLAETPDEIILKLWHEGQEKFIPLKKSWVFE